ncbi:MAG: hypothetical protein G5Z42_05065 [Caldisphaeraceae archaeon]|nr:hypothetical protein [Caldisphaeraceae archaeon]
MVIKAGISLPDDMYRELQDLSLKLGYPSLSSVARDAIELFIAFRRWWIIGGPIAGTFQILFKEKKFTVGRHLLRLEIKYKDAIRGSIEISYPNNIFLHIVILHGDGSRIKRFYKELIKISGIIVIQPSLFPLQEK